MKKDLGASRGDEYNKHQPAEPGIFDMQNGHAREGMAEFNLHCYISQDALNVSKL